jgi:predicted transcriptional regulator
MPNENPDMLLEVTTEIVSAYVSRNSMPRAKLADLIASVSASLSGLSIRTEVPPVLHPAVNPKKSVFPNHIVCLEDGKKFRSLKRHVASHGLTPAEYRAKWNLPPDYPMVAPAYSAERSEIAKKMGLGKRRAPATKGRRGRAPTP